MSIEKKKLIEALAVGMAAVMTSTMVCGCGQAVENLPNSENNAETNILTDGNISKDDSLASLTGKKKSEDEKVTVIPEDYEYTLDEDGFFYIGDMPEGAEDNYRNYYEIFVLSFYDSDGDGVGDINGVTQKLDYIQKLGFNGIWLMPIMSSPSYHKYDTDDYYLVDPSYGTNEDFQNLLEAAHDRGINVVIDFVVNHSSSEHPWFIQACDYLRSLSTDEEPDVSECPYIDYYHFSREWSSGYCKVEGTDWYYEGVFNYTQPDLNFDCEALRSEIADIACFWTNMGVDGFRVDAAAHFEEGKTEYNKQVLAEIYETCVAIKPDFYMVSEVWLDEVTIANYYASGTPSFFNFDSADSSGKIVTTAKGNTTAEKFVNSMLKYQNDYAASNPDYIDAVFITNHDMTRVANQLTNDADSMKMACGLMMSMQGSSFVYYGEEIGMKSSGGSDENKRIAMYWSEDEREGITNGPENADKNIRSDFAAADEQALDPDSIMNYYRRAILMRNANPEIARGTMSVADELTCDNIAVIIKEYQGEKVVVIYNTGAESATVDLVGTEYADMAIAGELTIHPWESAEISGGIVSMPARSIVVLR